MEGKSWAYANTVALEKWANYIEIGLETYINNPSFCFIAGYTLLIHGFLIEKYQSNSERIGLDILNKALSSDKTDLNDVVSIILQYQKQRKYKPIKMDIDILKRVFPSDSLLDRYFIEIHGKC